MRSVGETPCRSGIIGMITMSAERRTWPRTPSRQGRPGVSSASGGSLQPRPGNVRRLCTRPRNIRGRGIAPAGACRHLRSCMANSRTPGPPPTDVPSRIPADSSTSQAVAYPPSGQWRTPERNKSTTSELCAHAVRSSAWAGVAAWPGHPIDCRQLASDTRVGHPAHPCDEVGAPVYRSRIRTAGR